MPIAQACGRGYPRRVALVQRSFACLIGMMLLVFAVSAPAKAVDQHSIAHWIVPVAADAHHHHDENGAVMIDHHAHDDEGAPASDDDGGHEHMSNTAHAPVAIETDAPIFASRTIERAPVGFGVQSAPPGLVLPPHQRPPSFA